jgi:hypothetical protein
MVAVRQKGAHRVGQLIVVKSVAEEAQRWCGPTIIGGEGVVWDGRGTLGNLLEDIARSEDDGT